MQCTDYFILRRITYFVIAHILLLITFFVHSFICSLSIIVYDISQRSIYLIIILSLVPTCHSRTHYSFRNLPQKTISVRLTKEKRKKRKKRKENKGFRMFFTSFCDAKTLPLSPVVPSSPFSYYCSCFPRSRYCSRFYYLRSLSRSCSRCYCYYSCCYCYC